MKKLLSVIIMMILCLSFFSACNSSKNSDISIVTTNFASYDFAKNIVGDSVLVTLLLPPGGESHSYEPTAKDIITISNCDVFIYNGGESEAWVEEVLASLDEKPTIIKMMDFVDLSHEEHKEHNHGVDEHIWTSPKFAIEIVSGIAETLCSLNTDESENYEKNASVYIEKIKQLDMDFTDLFADADKKPIVVADRFPFIHFANEYNINYYSAYNSCSEDAEPTPAIITELIDVIKKENISIIFHIEFSNEAVSNAISEDTNTIVKELHSCHSVTAKQLSDGVTYVDLMRKNYEVLKEAIQ